MAGYASDNERPRFDGTRRFSAGYVINVIQYEIILSNKT